MLRKSSVSTAAATAVESLENRRLLAASPLQVIGVKIAKAVDTDGTSLNQNRITIAFGTNGTVAGIRLLDATKIRSFGYANDLTNLSLQRKVTVGLTVSQSAQEPGVLTILTDRLIRKGSRLFIDLGALTDTKNREIVFDASSPAKTITFTVGQNKPRYTLANRNWRPTDLSYFSPDVFSSAPTPATASTAPSANTVRANLVTFMNTKVSKGLITAAQATSAVGIYDSATAIGIIPAANLRAALASLVGTVAEPAIGSFIGKSNVTAKPWTTVDFNALISNDAPTGETKISVNGRLYTYIRPSLAGEPFQVLSSILAREVMRQDATASNPSTGVLPDSQDESIVVSTVETTVYAQQLLVDPTVAGNGTSLVARANERLLALLNSGDTLFPYGGILQNPALTNNGNVFVGGKTNPGGYGDNTTVRSFENWIRREYASRGFGTGGTTSNATSVTILKNIVGTNGNFSLFGSEVQGFLDKRNAILTDAVYINLANTLKLTF